MDNKLFSVYVIRSLTHDRLYVGMATDVNLRLVQHNAGKSKYTQSFVPWELIYIEPVGPAHEARKREKYFKTHAGKNYLKNKGII